MRELFPHSPEFGRLLRGDEAVDLVLINLELARDADPALDPAGWVAAIDALADRVRPHCPPQATAEVVLGHINRLLYVEEGYGGNAEDYFDPRNSYLNEVIERRLGIPISLSILYAAIAGRLGLRLDGINTPLHFLLRVTEAEPALFVDPFHAGALLDRAGVEHLLSQLSGQEVRLGFEHFTPCNVGTVVSRMLRNLKRIYLERRDYALALRVVRRLAALNGQDLLEQRDWGLTALRADCPGEALDPLARYLAEAPASDETERIRGWLHDAIIEVARWN